MAVTPPRILITGVGNVLRQDDGFGIEVVHRLMEREHLPPTVRVLETGIAGIRLVQELMDGFDLLIVVDAVQRGGEPGQLYLLEAEIPDLNTYTFDDRNAFLADMHYTTPTRALTLAQALGVLPPEVYIMGCEVVRDDFELGMSQAVTAAVPKAVAQIDALIAQYVGRGAAG